ncbi:hypothetical protein R6Q57_001304 [Mikania cordata]
MDLPSIQARLHQNLPLVGRLFSLNTPPLNDELCRFSPPSREHRVKPSPYPPDWNSYLLRLVEKGESPCFAQANGALLIQGGEWSLEKHC